MGKVFKMILYVCKLRLKSGEKMTIKTTQKIKFWFRLEDAIYNTILLVHVI